MGRNICFVLLALTLSGCMDPDDPDAATHCLSRFACLDIPGNRGNGPGFWGTLEKMPAYSPPSRPSTVTCMQSGNITTCNSY
jgi:hypothetical protein